jgi:hypothetical protein
MESPCEKEKRRLGLKYRKMFWPLGRRSTLSLPNKLMLYKQILKPIRTYSIQLWGRTKQSNIKIIQRFQNKVLGNIINVPWYVRNSDLHRDMEIDTVDKEIKRLTRKREDRLHQHTNVEALQLLDNSDIVRRLTRVKSFELV